MEMNINEEYSPGQKNDGCEEHCVYTHVVSAQIYRSGAVVVRQGEVALKPGDNRFYIVGLGASLRPDSLRFKFLGNVPIKHCCFSEVMPLKFNLNIDGEQELKELKKKEAVLKEELKACEAQRESWKVNSNFTGRNSISLEQSIAYIKELPERLMDISGRISGLEEAIADCVQKREHLEALVKEEREQKRYGVLADICVLEGGAYAFELSCIENQASWNPFYELKAKDLASPVQVCMRANIVQNTGEDWNNIALTLFYGNMDQFNAVPVLPPWHVHFRPDIYAAGKNGTYLPPGGPENTPAPSEADFFEGLSEEALSDASGAFEPDRDIFEKYPLEGRFDVASGPWGIFTDVAVLSVEAGYIYKAVPKMGSAAFLTAHLKNIHGCRLLPARAEVFVGNTYAGSCTLSGRTGDGGLELVLGKDWRIEVSHRLLRQYHSTARFANTQVQNFEYEITAVNLKKENINLEITDQIPVSIESEITVEALELSGGELSKPDGKVTWRLELKPEERRSLRLAFCMTWPKNKTLSGSLFTGLLDSDDEPTIRRFCPACGAAQTQENIFCQNCGAKIL